MNITDGLNGLNGLVLFGFWHDSIDCVPFVKGFILI